MKRDALQRKFVQTFHAGAKPAPATAAQLDAVEAELQAVLPASLRQFLTRHGGANCPDLLELAITQETELNDLDAIVPGAELVEVNHVYWQSDLPDEYVGFAKDSMGNLFCFKRLPIGTERPDDLPVWLFDHESRTIEPQTESFDAMLAEYLRLQAEADGDA